MLDIVDRRRKKERRGEKRKEKGKNAIPRDRPYTEVVVVIECHSGY